VQYIAELVVITGCSSGLGRETVKNLLATDKYHVVGAVRDVDKMEAVAEIDEFNMDNFHIMECELNSFESVHKFCEDLKEYQLAKPIDRLICNAGGMFNLCLDGYCLSYLICTVF
jgi:NADP-dependent 3-hydroxy acid dehydrogenase YdfG